MNGVELAERQAEAENVTRLSAQGNVAWYDAKVNKARVAMNIVRVGRKTFFNQNGQWVDSSLKPDEVKNAKQIEQFSAEYFALAKRHGQYANSVLAMPGAVVVKLGDEVVAWTP